MRILVIEDEPTLQQQLREQLEKHAYTVDSSGDGEDGLFIAREYPLDAAIIDIGLPGLSGLDIIRQLRAEGNALPILVLTARGQWQDKVAGLEAGADDYLTKPFHFEELNARLHALLRRSANAPGNSMQCGNLHIDFSRQQVSLDEQPLNLTSFEYRLLEHLMRHAGEVLSKAALADYLYPHDDDRDSNVIEVMIARLRKKLDNDGSMTPIETLRGRGYRFTLCDRPA
ncbi:response regulator transcription factor [Sulfuriflexus sp.]|uniref:response regulator transcription factor n=1 Tax=Sulfuriflexus sp. TaxID=2015443 RepID=UPI0028CE7DFB|nr:response regulator transcription factor [Sulfuriflexus sp.]MDT8405183.1 response regulator transcription factor [Sulfuriflexus sp.]